jgi:hypothetical protein
MLVVFSVVLWIREPSIEIVLVALGVLMIQSTAWKLTNPFFPNERRYPELRNETDEFIKLVRILNRAALKARASGKRQEWAEYEAVLSAMHRSVDRMGALAGKELENEPTMSPEMDGPRVRTQVPT